MEHEELKYSLKVSILYFEYQDSNYSKKKKKSQKHVELTEQKTEWVFKSLYFSSLLKTNVLTPPVYR